MSEVQNSEDRFDRARNKNISSKMSTTLKDIKMGPHSRINKN